MQPAFSVILLTTLIGAGQGLFLALFTAQSYSVVELLSRPDPLRFFGLGSALALALLGAGLLASFFHLGRPERAWRAATQWRVSWLSREVVILPAFIALVALYGLGHLRQWYGEVTRLPSGGAVDVTLLIGLAGVALCFALYVCTGMIYACLRFIREWHTPFTVVNYVLLGGASGFTLAAALAAWAAPELLRFFAGWAVILTVLGLIGRSITLVRNARGKPRSTVQSAIGIRHPRIVQKSPGFIADSFNTREFFHGRSRAFLRSIKWAFLLLAFVLPALALAAAMAGGGAGWVAVACLTQAVGLLAERWFFFAQANHPQNHYYQIVG